MSYQEARAAHINDLENGQMKQVSIGETPVLLTRIDGVYHAFAAHCTHYGAPLAEGAICGNRLICPWHHACFDPVTGQHLDAPGLDGLARYEVRIEGNDVIVRLPAGAGDRRPNPMATRDPADKRLFIVLGGGAAGAYAAEGMREGGFRGRILLISAEDELPYDRPNCSKDYLADAAPEEWMPLRSRDFYREHDIELLTGATVTAVDPRVRRVEFAGREPLSYDQLVVCTGSSPRVLPVPGMDLDHVFTLRSLADSRAIRERARNSRRAVVIGASFIGLEGAASLRAHGCDVTVVAPETVPLGRVFGDRIGGLIESMHREEGVRFRLGRQVQGLIGNRRVETVVLDDGERLEADLVLAGIGVQPNTAFLRGVTLDKDGGLTTDEHLQVQPGLYAAGDVARFPYPHGPARIEHWQVACQQGRIAGLNMAGKRTPFSAAPFFWTRQHGTSLQYIGHATDPDRILYDGHVDKRDFLAFYIQNGRIAAVAGMGRARELAAIQELMRENRMPDPREVEKGKVDWLERAAVEEPAG